MSKRIRAWHFMGTRNGQPVLRDGNTVAPGYVYSVKGPLVMCEWGLHQSVRAIDALKYAPGNWVGLCEAWGDVQHDNDKFVALHREYLWVADAEATLRHFARLCALDVIDKWDAPEIVVRYLKTGDESIRYAARDAAWDAAGDAAGNAAGDAAGNVARCAARYAAWNAARYAARYAARDAAGYAAGSAAWSAAKRNAAWDAWGVARGAQNERLETMLHELGETA